MDLGRPKQATGSEMPNSDIPALESVVRSHSAQLSKLNTELSSAFSQVTGEMGEIKSSSAATASTVASLANQVVTLTSMLAKLLLRGSWKIVGRKVKQRSQVLDG